MKRSSLYVLALLVTMTLAGHAQSLTSNNWAVIEMRSPNKPPYKLSGLGTNLNFLANSKWELLHSNGTAETGTFKMAGKNVHMLYDGGELFGDYNVSFNQGHLILEGVGSTKGYGYTLEKTKSNVR